MSVMNLAQTIVDQRYKNRYMVTKSLMVCEVIDKDSEEISKKLIVSTDPNTALWDFVGMVNTVAHDMVTYYAEMEPEYPDE